MSGAHTEDGAAQSHSALARDAADAAQRLRSALARHGLAAHCARVRGEVSGDGRPMITLDPISVDVALALADLLDHLRPGDGESIA